MVNPAAFVYPETRNNTVDRCHMPIDILLDKTTRTLRTHASGDVTIEDFIDSLKRLSSSWTAGSLTSHGGKS